MTADHEAAIRAATDALATAILAAVRAEAIANDAGPEQLLSIDRAAVTRGSRQDEHLRRDRGRPPPVGQGRPSPPGSRFGNR